MPTRSSSAAWLGVAAVPANSIVAPSILRRAVLMMCDGPLKFGLILRLFFSVRCLNRAARRVLFGANTNGFDIARRKTARDLSRANPARESCHSNLPSRPGT
jgi:hypothetical protein